MAITGLRLRTAAPMGDWRSFLTVAPGGGCIQGGMTQVEDTVGVYVTTEDAAEEVALIYHAEKIIVPKEAGTGLTFSKGQKIYYDAANNQVTPTAGVLEWIGIATEDATAAATTVEIDLKGDKAT